MKEKVRYKNAVVKNSIHSKDQYSFILALAFCFLLLETYQ